MLGAWCGWSLREFPLLFLARSICGKLGQLAIAGNTQASPNIKRCKQLSRRRDGCSAKKNTAAKQRLRRCGDEASKGREAGKQAAWLAGCLAGRRRRKDATRRTPNIKRIPMQLLCLAHLKEGRGRREGTGDGGRTDGRTEGGRDDATAVIEEARREK